MYVIVCVAAGITLTALASKFWFVSAADVPVTVNAPDAVVPTNPMLICSLLVPSTATEKSELKFNFSRNPVPVGTLVPPLSISKALLIVVPVTLIPTPPITSV